MGIKSSLSRGGVQNIWEHEMCRSGVGCRIQWSENSIFKKKVAYHCNQWQIIFSCLLVVHR